MEIEGFEEIENENEKKNRRKKILMMKQIIWKQMRKTK